MAYDPYVIGNPNGAAGTGATFATQLQVNLDALLHGIIMGVGFPGWNFAITTGTGTAEQPQYHTFSNGVYRVRATITWNVNGNPSVVLWEFSSNSGALYNTIKTVTYTYDGNQNVTSYTWS